MNMLKEVGYGEKIFNRSNNILQNNPSVNPEGFFASFHVRIFCE
jgi:hypothetical protein